MKQLAEAEITTIIDKKAENELALIEFGRELNRLRRSKKLTQKQLHELTGIDKTVISDLENGNYMPSLVIIRQLATGLDVSPYSLISVYYGIPVPGFDSKTNEALTKIRDVIFDYYLSDQDNETAARQRLRIAQEEEADILADLTPDVHPHPVEAPPQTINHNLSDS